MVPGAVNFLQSSCEFEKSFVQPKKHTQGYYFTEQVTLL
jgi:hypothetical protein